MTFLERMKAYAYALKERENQQCSMQPLTEADTEFYLALKQKIHELRAVKHSLPATSKRVPKPSAKMIEAQETVRLHAISPSPDAVYDSHELLKKVLKGWGWTFAQMDKSPKHLDTIVSNMFASLQPEHKELLVPFHNVSLSTPEEKLPVIEDDSELGRFYLVSCGGLTFLHAYCSGLTAGC